MAKRSIFEGESLMLVLHPVFLVATIAHLIGYGARWAWQAVTGTRQPEDDVVEGAEDERAGPPVADAEEARLDAPSDGASASRG